MLLSELDLQSARTVSGYFSGLLVLSYFPSVRFPLEIFAGSCRVVGGYHVEAANRYWSDECVAFEICLLV